MKKFIFSVLFTALFALPAFSQMKNMPMNDHKDGYGHMMEMGNIDRMGDVMGMCIYNADKIGLTDDQINKMKPQHREMQKKNVRTRADLKIAEIELMEIMEVKDFDLEKAGSAVKKIEGMKSAHHLDMLNAMKEMRALLTDEQFKNMKKLMPMKMSQKKPDKRMMKNQKR